NVYTLRGGKSAAADLGAAHLANQRARVQDTECARDRPSGGGSACQPPPGDSAGRLERLYGECVDNERPGLGGWNGHARGTPNVDVHRPLTALGTQKAQAWEY